MLDMKTSRRMAAACAALMISFVAAGCHHTVKRGPATGSTPNGASGGYDSGNPRTESLPNGGADIQPVDPYSGRSGDLSDPMGEGGPLADIRFDLDSAALSPAAEQTLSAHATWLKDHVRQAVKVEGHCDERGTVEYNLALGEQRAKAVYDHLIGLGVPAAQMQTVSFGKERPLDTGHSEEAFAKNRRVHFAVEGAR
jgi:peptidoglycan-associated lipoprotein